MLNQLRRGMRLKNKHNGKIAIVSKKTCHGWQIQCGSTSHSVSDVVLRKSYEIVGKEKND
jgi:hypothetical protein